MTPDEAPRKRAEEYAQGLFNTLSKDRYLTDHELLAIADQMFKFGKEQFERGEAAARAEAIAQVVKLINAIGDDWKSADYMQKKYAADYLVAAIEQLPSSPPSAATVRDGYALVPMEPTEAIIKEMLNAYKAADYTGLGITPERMMLGVWRSALAASQAEGK